MQTQISQKLAFRLCTQHIRPTIGENDEKFLPQQLSHDLNVHSPWSSIFLHLLISTVLYILYIYVFVALTRYDALDLDALLSRLVTRDYNAILYCNIIKIKEPYLGCFIYIFR